MKRKILAVLLCSLSLQIFPLTAYGQSSFKDVPIDSTYYREIDYFREHEIIKGTGDGCFRPNSNITATDYLIMLYNATGYACNLYGCPEYLFIDIIDNFGIRHLTEKKYISKLDVLVQGCKALDIMPYSAKYYSLDGFERFSALSQDEQDVLMLCGRNAVLDLSAETSDTLTAPVTRGEAAKLLYNLIQFHYLGRSNDQYNEKGSGTDNDCYQYGPYGHYNRKGNREKCYDFYCQYHCGTA